MFFAHRFDDALYGHLIDATMKPGTEQNRIEQDRTEQKCRESGEKELRKKESRYCKPDREVYESELKRGVRSEERAGSEERDGSEDNQVRCKHYLTTERVINIK